MGVGRVGLTGYGRATLFHTMDCKPYTKPCYRIHRYSQLLYHTITYSSARNRIIKSFKMAVLTKLIHSLYRKVYCLSLGVHSLIYHYQYYLYLSRSSIFSTCKAKNPKVPPAKTCYFYQNLSKHNLCSSKQLLLNYHLSEFKY